MELHAGTQEVQVNKRQRRKQETGKLVGPALGILLTLLQTESIVGRRGA
jgi:hypothetical protein